MHDTGLHGRVGPCRSDRFRQAPQPVTAHDQRIREAAVSQLGEHRRPLLGALAACGAQPQAQHVSLTSQVDADGDVHGPVGDLGAADLDHDRVDQQHRIHRVQRPVLPHRHASDDLVSDLRDRLAAHLGVIDLRKVRLDLSGGESLRIQRNHIG